MRRTLTALCLTLVLGACAKSPNLQSGSPWDLPSYVDGRAKDRVDVEKEPAQALTLTPRNASGTRNLTIACNGWYACDGGYDPISSLIEAANYYFQHPRVKVVGRNYLDSQANICTKFTVKLVSDKTMARLMLEDMPIYYSYYGSYSNWNDPYGPSFPVTPPTWTRSGTNNNTLVLTVEVPQGQRAEATWAVVPPIGESTTSLTMTTTTARCANAYSVAVCSNSSCTQPIVKTITTNLSAKVQQAQQATYDDVMVGSSRNVTRLVGRPQYDYYDPFNWGW